MKETPVALDEITDVVLAYRPKPKTKVALKRLKVKEEQETKDKSEKIGT